MLYAFNAWIINLLLGCLDIMYDIDYPIDNLVFNIINYCMLCVNLLYRLVEWLVLSQDTRIHH